MVKLLGKSQTKLSIGRSDLGKPVDEIAEIILRGPLGVDGFCRWLRAFVYKLKAEESLLDLTEMLSKELVRTD